MALIAGTVGAAPAQAAPPKDHVVSPLKPKTYRYSSPQGPRCIPVRNGTTMHLGQDLPANEGNAIYAVADGVVTATHRGARGGSSGYLIVRHVLSGNTYYTAYIHMWDGGKFVKVGQKVKAGQKIAEVGNSGPSTAPHLHFEVWGSAGWMKGPTIEPMAWLKRYGVDMRANASVVYNFTLPKSCNYWAASDLNLRSSSSSGSKLVKKVPKGTPMTSTPGAYLNGYVKVVAAGTSGWALHGAVSPTRVTASTNDIEVVPLSTADYSTTGAVNLRQGPSTAYKSLGVVPKNAQVKVNGTAGGWMRVVYKTGSTSTTGFIAGSYLKRSAPAVTKPPVTKPKPAAPAKPTKSVPRQTTSAVNMRRGAGTSHPTVLVLPKGAKVAQISASGGWSKVTYSGKTGYVATSFLRNVPSTPAKAPVKKPAKAPVKAPAKKPAAKSVTKVTKANLNMRSGAGTKYKSVLVIPKNAKVAVASTAKSWAKVTYQGKKGYVAASYLKTAPATKAPAKKPVTKPTKAPVKKPAKAPAKKPAAKSVTKVTKANLNMRSGAGTKYKSVLVIPKNAKVAVASTAKSWAKVTYQGKKGYVAASYLKTVAPAKAPVRKPAKAPAKSVTKVTKANLNMRSGAGTKYKSVLVIPKNAKVAVASTAKSWAKVTYKGKKGYVAASYLK
ncbi:SH3 domain-containing protein [Arthrobacter rhombi]|uniref:SH3 domain-containing protein n=1 Tax=Arthrobacter rhombi TaxID=71253 RepID=UPI003FD1DEC3